MKLLTKISLIVSLSICMLHHSYSSSDYILYLNSYHVGYRWSEEVTAGVRSVFDTVENGELFIEYLDTKEGYNDTHMKLYYEMLKAKFSKRKFSIILVSDNNALDFVLQYRDSVFFDAPVVFCGITDLENYDTLAPNIWGVWEGVDFNGMFTAIEKVLPELETIHVVVDKTKTGRVFYDKIKMLQHEGKLHSKINFIEEINLENINSVFKEVRPKDVIFYAGVHIDENGLRLNTHTVVSKIYNCTKAPIFTYPFFLPNSKLAGGIVLSGREQGKLAAIKGYRVLKGKTDGMPVITKPRCSFMFNYSGFGEHNFKYRELPNEAILTNSPLSFFSTYKTQWQVVGSIILFLVVMLFIMSRILIVKNRYQKELILAKKRAENSDQLKSKFLSNISHEVRTPLNAIIGFSDLIVASEENDSSTKQLYLEKITSSGENLTTLIDDIITLSKLETGDYKVELKKSSIAEIFNQLAKLYAEEVLSDTLELMHVENDLYINSDELVIREIFIKLIDNAFKFTKDGKVEVRISYRKDKTIFSVKDSGAGIRKENQEEIFMTLNKIEDGLRFHQGVGAGLSISKQFVMLLNGNIWLESEPGKGAEFFFSIPSPAIRVEKRSISKKNIILK